MVTTPPKVHSTEELTAWAATADPGDERVYHVGNLIVDRDPAFSLLENPGKVDTIAATAMILAGYRFARGVPYYSPDVPAQVHLYQKRNDRIFIYIARKR